VGGACSTRWKRQKPADHPIAYGTNASSRASALPTRAAVDWQHCVEFSSTGAAPSKPPGCCPWRAALLLHSLCLLEKEAVPVKNGQPSAAKEQAAAMRPVAIACCCVCGARYALVYPAHAAATGPDLSSGCWQVAGNRGQRWLACCGNSAGTKTTSCHARPMTRLGPSFRQNAAANQPRPTALDLPLA